MYTLLCIALQQVLLVHLSVHPAIDLAVHPNLCLALHPAIHLAVHPDLCLALHQVPLVPARTVDPATQGQEHRANILKLSLLLNGGILAKLTKLTSFKSLHRRGYLWLIDC